MNKPSINHICLLVAMRDEAAAIAWVCALHETPFIALKAITNLLDLENSSELEFQNNFDTACESLTKALVDILGYVEDKSLSDLSETGISVDS